MTDNQLRRAEDRYQRAMARAQEALEARDRLIEEALASRSHAEIARATGLTRGRIGQIAMRKAKR